MLSSSLMNKGLWVVGRGLGLSLRLLRTIDGYFSRPPLETHGLTTSQFLSLMDSTKTEPSSSVNMLSTLPSPSFQELKDILERGNCLNYGNPSSLLCLSCGIRPGKSKQLCAAIPLMTSMQ